MENKTSSTGKKRRQKMLNEAGLRPCSLLRDKVSKIPWTDMQKKSEEYKKEMQPEKCQMHMPSEEAFKKVIFECAGINSVSDHKRSTRIPSEQLTKSMMPLFTYEDVERECEELQMKMYSEEAILVMPTDEHLEIVIRESIAAGVELFPGYPKRRVKRRVKDDAEGKLA